MSPPGERELTAARAFVASAIAPRADQFDAEGALPRELITAIAERGWLAAGVSPRRSGHGWDAVAVGRLHAEVGRGCGATRSLLTVQSMVTGALERWASEELAGRLVPGLARGEHIAALALSEGGAGSDIQALDARAVRSGDGFVLDGVKRWVSFGQIADVILVFARLDGAMMAFVLEGDPPGLARTPVTGLLGLRASQLANLELRGCFVPASHRIGSSDLPVSPVAATALDLGRYSVAWGSVGLAEACVEASIAHTRSRRQFGARLLDHQLVARHVTDMVSGARAARLLCEDAGARRQRGDAGAGLATLIAKYTASTAAARIAATAVQLHGASGCVAGSRVERHFRDAKILEIIEGSTEMQQLMIARHAELELGEAE